MRAILPNNNQKGDHGGEDEKDGRRLYTGTRRVADGLEDHVLRLNTLYAGVEMKTANQNTALASQAFGGCSWVAG